jgi:hypothetical protein
MRSRVAFAALAAATVLVTGCVGATAPRLSPSPVPTSSPAVASSAPVASTAPPPTTAPIPTAARPSSPTACPLPVTVDVLGGWSAAWPIDRVVDCFGARNLQVTGYLAPAWGIGGLPNGIVPGWLGEWEGLPAVLWLKPHPVGGCFAADDCMWLFLYAPSTAGLSLSPDRWVALTGHFDDPLAATCRATGSGAGAVTSDAQAIVECRKHFVVTGIRTVAPPAP